MAGINDIVTNPSAYQWGLPSLLQGMPDYSVSDTPIIPQTSGLVGMMQQAQTPNFMNVANLALSGLGTIGSLWGAFQANKLAKRQFNFTRDVTNTNLNNQIQSYNTSLADRSRSRAVVEGQTPAQEQAYVTANSLRRYTGG